VLVSNLPGARVDVPPGVRVLENERRLGFGANVNRGVRATNAELVVAGNPDIEAQPGALGALETFMRAHPRCGIAAPQLRYPDGRWQPSRRAFPTVSGSLVRRTPLRLALRPLERQRSHYLSDERPEEPVESDWMLGAFLCFRRTAFEQLGGYDEGFTLYGEDIDLCYRAAKAGWERWYVPQAVVVHRHQAVSDHRFLTRRTLWHWQSMLRFVRKHPERLRAL
jgi:GT2 family glycosyltransferase